MKTEEKETLNKQSLEVIIFEASAKPIWLVALCSICNDGSQLLPMGVSSLHRVNGQKGGRQHQCTKCNNIVTLPQDYPVFTYKMPRIVKQAKPEKEQDKKIMLAN